ncbi:MAG: hypothetical protein A2463_01070 [Candidatus Staskawiczbacteria bacterium RIFOXYC2_FULL_32_10]|nr:MAG: hypothetical protein A2463_01070 [Candidatus Staskawiczbacteria bacterium RIFOXYC2_FULL_32_10]
MDQEKRICQNCKKDFIIEPEDFAFYEKMKVPAPTFCWLCRAQRRMAFRNERVLYKVRSDFSGKDIFSSYSPDSGYKVYEKEVWLTDQWDPMEYAQDYDFSKPFFTQFDELLHKVPLKNLNVVNGVKSDYSNNATDPKNCYLCFNAGYIEDCMYSHGLSNCRNCVDVSHLSKCETCFDSFWLTSGTKNIGCNNCESCFNTWFSKNCVGCSDCVGCVGLRNKNYHIFNQPYSKEDYKEKLNEFNLGSYDGYQKMKLEAQNFWLKFPNKFLEGAHNSNVSGNYISHSKNVKNSFIIREGENLKFCQYLQENGQAKDSYDWSIWGDNGQMAYECHACGIGVSNIKFCYNVQENVHDIEYSFMCQSSLNLFGCVGLRKKQYCIFNKQYTKEEYENLVVKIRDQMDSMPYVDKVGRIYKYGEFFPTEISPVGYNESMSQEYFPLNREDAVSNGYKWRNAEDRNYKPTIKAEDLPSNIKDAPDSITSEIIACAHAGKGCDQLCVSAFKITSDELNFYRNLGVPLPRLCHNCRTFERLKQRTGLKLYSRNCVKCNKGIETAYRPDQPEIVYCEQCYQQEVV